MNENIHIILNMSIQANKPQEIDAFQKGCEFIADQ